MEKIQEKSALSEVYLPNKFCVGTLVYFNMLLLETLLFSLLLEKDELDQLVTLWCDISNTCAIFQMNLVWFYEM